MIIHAKFKERLLIINDLSFSCVFGRDGISISKEEGDWKTPLGFFTVQKIYYRADRVSIPSKTIQCIAIQEDDGWCDDVSSPDYNKIIKIPSLFHFENLWREDCLYDVVLVLSYNTNPVIKGKGSAIFIHVAKDNMEFTQGCLALNKEDLLKIVSIVDVDSSVYIEE